MKPLDKETFFKVVYLDNHLLVLEKRADLLTQKEALNSQKINLEDLAKTYLKEEFSKEGNVFLHPIHRLDKPVSGLVLFARTSKALSRLNQQMREKSIIKKYKAWVEDILSQKKALLTHYLLHLEHKAKIVDKDYPEAKKAELTYEVIEELEDKSLIQINLLTGRYHQIRAQLSYIGHPVLGDTKYKSKIASDRIALHCYYLEFIHPVSKLKISLSSESFFKKTN